MDWRLRRRLLLYLLYKRRTKPQPKKRSCWVRPVRRASVAAADPSRFRSELNDLDEHRFKSLYGMKQATFKFILGRLSASLQGQNTVMRSCVPPDIMLAVTLRYFAGGISFGELRREFALGISTISGIIRKVSASVHQLLGPEAMPPPSVNRWKSIAARFEARHGFPHCIGAVAGKRIIVAKPEGDGRGDAVVLAVVDEARRFIYVEAFAHARGAGSAAFKESSLWKALEEDTLHLPGPEPINGAIPYPYAFVADETFALHENLLRPFGGRRLEENKKAFNSQLECVRIHAEAAFALLSNRWAIFRRPINVTRPFATDIIRTCCILHNIILDRDGYRFRDSLTIIGLADIKPAASVRGGLSANASRTLFVEYFSSSSKEKFEVSKEECEVSKVNLSLPKKKFIVSINKNINVTT